MASKSCKEFLTVKFHIVFKLFRYRVNASSNFAAVTFFTVFKMCRHRVNAVLVLNIVHILLILQPAKRVNIFDSPGTIMSGGTLVN